MARERKLPKGVRIRKNSKSESIQIAFTYLGIECRESLQMPPTQGNIRYAERLRHEILAEIERDTFNYAQKFPDSKRAKRFGFNTSKKFMDELLEDAYSIKEKQLKSSSLKMYRTSLDSHLLPSFDHLRADHVTSKIVREWFISAGLSAKSLRNHRIMLNLALDLAIQDNLIEHNPITPLRLEHILPKGKLDTKYKPDPLDKSEIKKVISAANDWFQPLLTVWVFSGMRPGEIIALTWKDIDIEAKEIHVNKSHVLGNKQTTKTENSNRVIDILPPAYAALKKQYARTFHLCGEKGHVFTYQKSKKPFMDHRNLSRYVWIPTIKKSGIRYRNQYQLRHTYASQLLTEGNDPWYVAQQLGHKGIDMINRSYGQWIRNNDGDKYQVKGDWDSLV